MVLFALTEKSSFLFWQINSPFFLIYWWFLLLWKINEPFYSDRLMFLCSDRFIRQVYFYVQFKHSRIVESIVSIRSITLHVWYVFVHWRLLLYSPKNICIHTSWSSTTFTTSIFTFSTSTWKLIETSENDRQHNLMLITCHSDFITLFLVCTLSCYITIVWLYEYCSV